MSDASIHNTTTNAAAGTAGPHGNTPAAVAPDANHDASLQRVDKGAPPPGDTTIPTNTPATTTQDPAAAAPGDARDDERGETTTTAADDDGPEPVPLGLLFGHADGCDKFLMGFGAVIAFLNGASMPAFSEVFGDLILELAQPGADVEKEVGRVALIMVYVGLVVFVLSAIQVATWMVAAERQMSRIRGLYFDALMNQDGEFYDTNKPGGLTARLVGDTKVMKAGINDKVATGIMNFGMFFFGYGFGFYRSWELTLVMLSTLPLLMGTGILMENVLSSMTQQSRKHFALAGEVSEEVLQSVRTVQLFGGQDREVNRFVSMLSRVSDASIKKEFTTSLSMGVSYGILFASYSLAFWFGGYLIREGRSDVGAVTAVFFSVLFGSLGLGLIFPSLGALAESQAAAAKIFEVLGRTPTIDARAGGKRPAALHGAIEFRDVKFSYPTRRDVKLFEKLNLTVEAGTTVAFSGASGSGKSSLIALVQRIYDVEAGSVLVDGTDIRELDLGWWRDNIGIVSQEPCLFSGTILDNVRVGKPDATKDEIIDACKKANVHETVLSLPDQYDTDIGSVGSQLSGGQKQRLAIARAIIRRPKLLILDEATSALDRKSEAEVQAALDEIMNASTAGGGEGQKFTTLVIAHRLTTIRNADVIHFITHDDVDGSFVAESGGYTELVERGGQFAAMVSKQVVSSRVEEEMAGGDDESSPASVGASVNSPDVQPPPRGSTEPVSATTTSAGTGAGGASHPTTPHGSALKTPGTMGDGGMSSFAVAMDADSTLEERAAAEEEAQDASLGRVMGLAGSKKWAIVVGLFASLIAGGLYPAYAVVLSKMLEVLGTKTNDEIEDQSGFWAGMFCVIGLTAFVGYTLQGVYGIAGEHITIQLREQLFRNILRQDQAFFDTPGRDVGSLGKALEGDTEAVHLLFGPALGYKVQMACNLLVGCIIAFIWQWELALVTVSVIPLMVLAGAVQQMLISGFSEDSETGDGVVGESLGNVRTVLAFNMAWRQADRFRVIRDADSARGTKVGIIAGIVFGISQFTFYGVFALSFWYGGRLLAAGEANFVDIMIASTAILMGAMGAGEAGGFAAKTDDATRAAKKVFALIDHVPRIDNGSGAGDKDLGGDGAALSFDGVRFVYPARPKVAVLKGFSDEFGDGQSVGLMGSTGCGKSTIIQMLGRFYDPVKGNVRVNGKDLRSLDIATWRSELSAVLQEPSLFSGSVRENIRYSRPEATDAEVEAAARLAAVHDEIAAMSEGYATDVGYMGRALSGGQKQRVAIARAVLRRPRLLLLDEATSALDNATEAKVMAGLAEYCKEHRMTIVSVAHRLTTIQQSDKIVLLDAGVVLEKGTHNELVAKDGHYARRWEHYQAGMR